MWEKWKEAGGVEGMDEALEREEGFKRADLKIENPDKIQNNYKIAFESGGASDWRWVQMYVDSILEVAKRHGWPYVYWQTGNSPEAFNPTHHEVELWDDIENRKPREAVEAIFSEVHEEARLRLGKLKDGERRKRMKHLLH